MAPFKSTELVCLCCGNVMTINRTLNHLKSVGHIKDMYCPFCDKDVKFFEVRDVSIFKWQCLAKSSLTNNELLVMSLLEKREKNDGQSEIGIHKKILTQRPNR